MGRTFLLVPVLFAAAVANAQTYRYEVETAQARNGVLISSQVPGFSGTGYLTDFNKSTDYFEMNVAAPSGLYEMWVGYRSHFGEKGYRYRIGDEYGTGMFEQTPASPPNNFQADRAGLFNLSIGNR